MTTTTDVSTSSATGDEPGPVLDAGVASGLGVDEHRWENAWEHRPLLIAMARSRVGWHEAEDVVSEALLRVQQAPDLADAALRAWLVTTTLRLCADVHRSGARDVRRRQRLAGYAPPVVPGPEDDVVDQDQARWLADQLHRLPGHQAEVLELRSEGYEVGSIAHRLGLPYKAVESALSRARRSLRGWAAAAVGFWAVSRFLTRRTAQLHVAAAVCCAAAGFASPLVGAATSVSERGGSVHQIAPRSHFETQPPVAPGADLHL